MSLLSVIKSIFGMGPKTAGPGDRSLVCMDCSDKFIFDAGEQQFFKSKGFTDPKRCPTCRKKVKSQLKKKRRGGRGGGGGGGGNGNNGGGRSSHRRFMRRSGEHSLIDGDSPYADER
jgi:hypothetical protein